jgi:short-subunit dehydrogenase
MPLNTPIRDWKNKRVWIIGASTGIGAALADLLAERGAHLALSARNRERLERVARRYPGCVALPLDLTEPHTLLPSVLQLLDIWGGLDMVVLSAGTYAPLRAGDLTIEGARQTIETNLMGVINGTAAVLPQLLQQGEGAIAIVGSAAGYRGVPKALAYGAAKAAVINFAEALHHDLASTGVSVFLVNPGFAENPAASGSKAELEPTAREAAEHILEGIARGRFEIHFARLTYVLKFLRFLPERIYARAVRRVASS